MALLHELLYFFFFFLPSEGNSAPSPVSTSKLLFLIVILKAAVPGSPLFLDGGHLYSGWHTVTYEMRLLFPSFFR